MKIRASSPRAQRLLQAAADGDLESLREEDASPVSNEELQSARCSSGCSALHWAAGSNQVEVIQYLILERCFHVDIPCTRKAKGRTPLHYACRNGCTEAARLLVSLAAQVSIFRTMLRRVMNFTYLQYTLSCRLMLEQSMA
jgi:ankyrin repeat protein